jgi:GNAT superfamily N-acetyltransferase
MNGARVRRARPADRAEAVALWQALHREHEALDPRYRLAPDAALRWANDFDEWVREGRDLVLVAEASAGLVGLLVAHLAYPIPAYAPTLFAHVDDVFVSPEWRGRGVGRALLAEAERWARGEGAAHLQAGVLAPNADGRAFWSRVGTDDYMVIVTKPLG